MNGSNESTDDEFYAAIGRAIITWQQVEIQSAHVFTHLLAAFGVGAMAVFHHIKNASTRIEMMNIAARFLFMLRPNDELRSEWQNISSRLSQANTIRNRLAHSEPAETMTATGWEFSLKSPSLDWSRLDPDKFEKWLAHRDKTTLAYSEINDATTLFGELACELQDFARRVLEMNLLATSQQSDKTDILRVRGSGSYRPDPTEHLPLPPEPRRRKSQK